MAVNRPVGDNARMGSGSEARFKTKIDGAGGWTKRSRVSGEFMAVKRPGKKAAAEVQGRPSRTKWLCAVQGIDGNAARS